MNKRKHKKKLTKGWKYIKGQWEKKTMEDFWSEVYPPSILSQSIYKESPLKYLSKRNHND